MADVFISYAHTTSKQAQAAAAALRAAGYSVWLDDELAAHLAFTHAIEEQLTAARAALVIWSADAARSEWVLSEANRAREDRKLVQLVIDKTRLPMPFDQVQCADLSGWTGEAEHPNWRRVAASIGELVGRKDGAPAPAPQASTRAPEAAIADPLLAVLAFENLSGDPEMAYFSDGVSEEILQTVARGADLKVIGRASSFQFRGADKAAAKVAAALKATHVLDGSVRRAGPKVRIAANLIECARETTMWSDRYDRDLSDVFALQDEIATAVAAALKTAFAKSAQPAPIDPIAYDLFLQVQAQNQSGFEGPRQRIRLLEEVVARAPSFAPAWALLAFTQASNLMIRRDEAVAAGLTYGRAVEAAMTALRLDPDMGRAYQALDRLEPWAAYRDREALQEKALAAMPNDAGVLATAGVFYGSVGRLREGLALARRACELDPLLPLAANNLPLLLNVAGFAEEAGRLTDANLARWPEQRAYAGVAMMAAARRGDRAEVEALIAHASPELEEMIWFARNLLEPDPGAIREGLNRQRAELARTGTLPLVWPVWLYGLGLKDEAVELLDKASFAYLFDRQSPSPSGTIYPGSIFSPTYGFPDDPRFVRLCGKLGLCDYWIDTGKWPDCADEVAYDFRAEARTVAAERLARRV